MPHSTNSQTSKASSKLSEVYLNSYVPFHLAEFTALKSEIAEHVKSTYSYLQYAIAISGGITAWLLVKDPEALTETGKFALRIAWSLPLIFSTLYALLSLATYMRIGDIADYLRELEDTFKWNNLGWEERFKRRLRVVGAIHILTWLFVLTGTFWLALNPLKG